MGKAKIQSRSFKYLYLLIAVLALALWVGASLHSSQRIESIRWLLPESVLEDKNLSPYLDHLQIIIDTTYEAINVTQGAILVWSKVGFLTVGPLMKVLVTTGTMVGYLLSFLFPFVLWLSEYFAIFWQNFLVVSEKVWIFSKPYLAQALEVLGESGKRAGILFLEQDKWNIFFEVMTPLSLVLVVLLKKEFVRRRYHDRIQMSYNFYREKISKQYIKLIQYIQKKSMWVASFIPHMLLLVPIGILIYFLPDLLFAISRGYILLLVSLCYPIFNSAHSIQSGNLPEQQRSLSYWIVFSVITLFQGLVLHIPFASRLLPEIPYFQEGLFFFYLWLQFPWTDGSGIMYKIVVPVVSRLIALLPIPSSVENLNASEEKRNYIVKLLINTFVPEAYRAKTTEFIFHSGYLICGVIFFLTPPYFTSIGSLLMGLLLPYYSSITAMVNLKPDVADTHASVSWWLQYWICLFLFFVLHDFLTEIFVLHNFPFWYAGKLAIVLWLQVPLFRGAEQIYAKFFLPAYLRLLSLFESAGESFKANIMSPRGQVTPEARSFVELHATVPDPEEMLEEFPDKREREMEREIEKKALPTVDQIEHEKKVVDNILEENNT